MQLSRPSCVLKLGTWLSLMMERKAAMYTADHVVCWHVRKHSASILYFKRDFSGKERLKATISKNTLSSSREVSQLVWRPGVKYPGRICQNLRLFRSNSDKLNSFNYRPVWHLTDQRTLWSLFYFNDLEQFKKNMVAKTPHICFNGLYLLCLCHMMFPYLPRVCNSLFALY